MNIFDEKTKNKIINLNRKVNELYGFNSDDIISNIEKLMNNGEVSIGYRACCGSKDKTHKVFDLWVRAVSILSKSGINIDRKSIKIDNSYATISGGFWNEYIYYIVKNED